MKARIVSGVVLLAAAGGALATEPASLPPPPPELSAMQLPTGVLQPVYSSGRGAFFLDVSNTVTSGGIADVSVFEVYDPAIPTGYGAAVQAVSGRQIDCAARTSTSKGLVAFDGDGRPVMWLPGEAPEKIEPNDTNDFLARVACDGAKPPAPQVVGHEAALSFGRTVLRAGR